EERHQPSTVPDRLFKGLPRSTKCDGFFGPHFFRDLRCHDGLLSMCEVSAKRKFPPVISGGASLGFGSVLGTASVKNILDSLTLTRYVRQNLPKQLEDAFSKCVPRKQAHPCPPRPFVADA